jgi:outer membrane protein OmpA-like peptidoglycan-associated protein
LKTSHLKKKIQEKNQPTGHRPGNKKVEEIMIVSFSICPFGVPMPVQRKAFILLAVCLFMVVASQASALVIRQETTQFSAGTVRFPVGNTFMVTNTISGNKRACSGATSGGSSVPTTVSLLPVPAPSCQLPVAHFSLGDSDLSPSEIDLILTGMKQCQIALDTPLHIIGHTCKLGKDQDNQVLSTKRAESVAAVLKAHGYTIAGVKGVGAQHPVTTDKGLIHLNRRVEITK